MTSGELALDRLFAPGTVDDPHPYYRALLQDDPVHEVAGTSTFVVSQMALIQEVVADPETFSSATSRFLHLGEWTAPALRPAMTGLPDDVGGAAVATTDPPDHARQRKVVSRRLSTAKIQAMEPDFRDLAQDVIRSTGQAIEWMSQFAEPLPMVMVARVLGLADEEAATLKRQGYAMVERISGFVPEAQIEPLEAEGVQQLAPVIDAFLRAKNGTETYDDGLIGIVKRAVDDGELNDLEAFGILSVIIAAGGESTTSLIGTAVKLLAEDQQLQQQLRADASLIPTFVEEALRVDPPFRGHYRVARRDVVLGGKSIPQGSHLLLAWPAANRDPEFYDDPDVIRLDRLRVRSHVGFGWGIHLCVGAPLARMETRVALETLLERTKSFHLDPDAPAPSYHPSLVVRRLQALHLRLEIA